MGKCSKCGKKILYNKYVIFKGRVLCNPCNIARLLKETTDKEKAKADRAAKKLLKPSKKAKKAAEKMGIDIEPAELKEDNDNEKAKDAENSE